MAWSCSIPGWSMYRSGGRKAPMTCCSMTPNAASASPVSGASGEHRSAAWVRPTSREKPMNVPEQAEVLELLQYRREAIADHWHRAIAHTSFVPLSFSEVSQRLVALTDRVSALLLADAFVPGQAQEIGETLVQLHYAHPLALGKTQEVLAQELTAGLPAETVVALQPRLATILGELATGFFERARASILDEQETIRGALLTARMRVEEALRE